MPPKQKGATRGKPSANKPSNKPAEPAKRPTEENVQALKAYHESMNSDNYLVEVHPLRTWDTEPVSRSELELVRNKLKAWVHNPTEDQAMPVDEALDLSGNIQEAMYARYGVIQKNGPKLNLHFPEGEWEGKWKVKWETVQNAITKEERDEDERQTTAMDPDIIDLIPEWEEKLDGPDAEFYREAFARYKGYMVSRGHWPPKGLLKNDVDRARLDMKTVGEGELQQKFDAKSAIV